MRASKNGLRKGFKIANRCGLWTCEGMDLPEATSCKDATYTLKTMAVSICFGNRHYPTVDSIVKYKSNRKKHIKQLNRSLRRGIA